MQTAKSDLSLADSDSTASCRRSEGSRRSSDPGSKTVKLLSQPLLRGSATEPALVYKGDWLDDRAAFAEFGLGMSRMLSSTRRLGSAPEEGELLDQNDVAFTLAAFAFGAAVLSIPHALAATGLAGIAVIFVLNAIAGITSGLMSKVLDHLAPVADSKGIPPLQRDWTFLAAEVWGPTGKFFMRVFLAIELCSYIVVFPVVASAHLKELSRGIYPLSSTTCAVASTVVTLLLCLLPPKAFVPVNAAASLLFFAGCLAILGTGLMLPEWPELQQQPILNPPGLMNGVGIFLFAGATHSAHPTIKQTMQDPKQYEQANIKGYIGLLLLLLLIDVPIFLMFGKSADQTFVTNIGMDLDMQPLDGFSGWPALRALSVAGIIIKNLCSVPFSSKPLAVMMVGICSTPGQKSGPFGLSEDWAINICQALVLLVGMFFSIRFADDMALVVDVVGGVLCSNISLVVPPLAYWTLFRKDLGLMTQAALILSVVIGVAMICDTLIIQFVG